MERALTFLIDEGHVTMNRSVMETEVSGSFPWSVASQLQV
jgi:hypothetical protein